MTPTNKFVTADACIQRQTVFTLRQDTDGVSLIATSGSAKQIILSVSADGVSTHWTVPSEMAALGIPRIGGHVAVHPVR